MISLLVNLIIYILVLGVLYWLVIYVVDAIPIPQPANRAIKIIVTVLIALVVVLLLLQMAGVDVGGAHLPVAPRP